jgi:hypothetical protein
LKILVNGLGAGLEFTFSPKALRGSSQSTDWGERPLLATRSDGNRS